MRPSSYTVISRDEAYKQIQRQLELYTQHKDAERLVRTLDDIYTSADNAHDLPKITSLLSRVGDIPDDVASRNFALLYTRLSKHNRLGVDFKSLSPVYQEWAIIGSMHNYACERKDGMSIWHAKRPLTGYRADIFGALFGGNKKEYAVHNVPSIGITDSSKLGWILDNNSRSSDDYKLATSVLYATRIPDGLKTKAHAYLSQQPPDEFISDDPDMYIYVLYAAAVLAEYGDPMATSILRRLHDHDLSSLLADSGAYERYIRALNLVVPLDEENFGQYKYIGDSRQLFLLTRYVPHEVEVLHLPASQRNVVLFTNLFTCNAPEVEDYINQEINHLDTSPSD